MSHNPRKLHPLEHDTDGWSRYFEERRKEREAETIQFNERLASLTQLGARTVEGIAYGYFELEDGSVIRVRRRTDQLWSLESILHIEADEIEAIRTPLTRVKITRRSDGFHACFDGEPEKWECAGTAAAAIGQLVISHMERFGIRGISFPKS